MKKIILATLAACLISVACLAADGGAADGGAYYPEDGPVKIFTFQADGGA